MSLLMIVIVVFGLYILVVLGVGWLAICWLGKFFEEFFVVGWLLGLLIFFMFFFGINCIFFVLIGILGKVYYDGVGLFGLNVFFIVLGIFFIFWVIGVFVWCMGV